MVFSLHGASTLSSRDFRGYRNLENEETRTMDLWSNAGDLDNSLDLLFQRFPQDGAVNPAGSLRSHCSDVLQRHGAVS